MQGHSYASVGCAKATPLEDGVKDPRSGTWSEPEVAPLPAAEQETRQRERICTDTCFKRNRLTLSESKPCETDGLGTWQGKQRIAGKGPERYMCV